MEVWRLGIPMMIATTLRATYELKVVRVHHASKGLWNRFPALFVISGDNDKHG